MTEDRSVRETLGFEPLEYFKDHLRHLPLGFLTVPSPGFSLCIATAASC